jgi:hypothetical protein
MFIIDVLFALLMAGIFTLIFAVAFRRPGPWSSVLAFFLVLFLASWAGGLWISPTGPAFIGIFWVPILLVALLVALLLASVGPQRPQRVETISEAQAKDRQRETTLRAFDAFFWALVIGFAIVIVLGYLW